jgi:hypothetical protein
MMLPSGDGVKELGPRVSHGRGLALNLDSFIDVKLSSQFLEGSEGRL